MTRKFTKDHNDIKWLFPNVTDANKTFDLFDSYGHYLLKEVYEDKEIFDKDDMIDSYMKGVSCGMQMFPMEQRNSSVAKPIIENIRSLFLEMMMDIKYTSKVLEIYPMLSVLEGTITEK